MPYEITLDDAARLVTITFSGTVPYTELLDLKEVVWPQYRGSCYGALADFTNAKLQASAPELRGLADAQRAFEVLAICGAPGSAEYGLGRMFERYSEKQRTVAVFSSCSQALQWLRSRATTESVTSPED
jgi:hypothetical protein